jgi:hypothetical protein
MRIFLCYRREDTRHSAGRLRDRLADRFGAQNVFIDVDSVAPGADYRFRIEHEIATCDALLVLIGTRWLAPAGVRRRSRLHDPDDLVRGEIETALASGVAVVPVLVDGAAMPHPRQLPDDLAPMIRRQALRVDHESFDTDVGTLISRLSDVEFEELGPKAVAESRAGDRSPQPRNGGAALLGDDPSQIRSAVRNARVLSASLLVALAAAWAAVQAYLGFVTSAPRWVAGLGGLLWSLLVLGLFLSTLHSRVASDRDRPVGRRLLVLLPAVIVGIGTAAAGSEPIAAELLASGIDREVSLIQADRISAVQPQIDEVTARMRQIGDEVDAVRPDVGTDPEVAESLRRLSDTQAGLSTIRDSSVCGIGGPCAERAIGAGSGLVLARAQLQEASLVAAVVEAKLQAAQQSGGADPQGPYLAGLQEQFDISRAQLEKLQAAAMSDDPLDRATGLSHVRSNSITAVFIQLGLVTVILTLVLLPLVFWVAIGVRRRTARTGRHALA